MKTSNQFVLIRGLGRESGHWLDFPIQLTSQFPDWKVDLEDLPGFGVRREMPFPRSIDIATDIIREEVLTKPAAKRVLIAMSLGGMIAADWIFRHPDDFAAAILVNTSFKGVSTVLERLQPEGFYALTRAAFENEPMERERRVLHLISNHRSERERALPKWAEIESQRPVQKVAFLTQLMAASKFKIPRGRPEIPVLIVNSKRDRMVNPISSERVAERWRCSLVTHPTAGHDLPLDDGPWLAKTIAQWLQTSGPKNVASAP